MIKYNNTNKKLKRVASPESGANPDFIIYYLYDVRQKFFIKNSIC